MTRGLKVEGTVRPKVYKVTLRGHTAMVEIQVVNGKAVYGFDEAEPDPVLEQALARYSPTKLAGLASKAVLS